ncbi:Hypothetical predicted protein [Mytilus galloprovincialis]|uniref:Reverse transcriptase domain-containing protein n=1 Tax=Mytilus galloprovincialis TaxID=29158 RepID=A0A8B6F713_MYTGA|nr:Hypothetical predicted protein [Mytilus galloprovincialis]
MPTYGRLDSLVESEDWTQYVERMEHYFNANEIEEDQKRDVFLSVCGKNTYKLIRDLLAPAKPRTKSLADLTKLVVKDHRDPVPSEIIQRFKFNSRARHSDESVGTFIAALRSLTEHCNYGDTLHAMLRDRLVIGTKSDHIQRRLLAEPNLTFEKAMEIATAMETAEKNAQDIQASGTNATFQKVNKVSKSYTRNNSGNSKQGHCYRCGGNHLAAECRFKDAKCHSCKKYNRLPYGIASSPGIFQRTLENVVQGIANVLVRVDDILITVKTREEHLNTLSEVLSRFRRIGIRLKKQKCVFMAEEVVYLGFKINKHGIYPVVSKVEAIDKAPSPTNVTELKAYLRMLNYNNRFLANLSHLLKPLHVLLQKDTKWSWGKKNRKKRS